MSNLREIKQQTEIDNLYKFLWESGYSIGEIDHITWGGWDESWGHKKERLNVHTEVDVAYWKERDALSKDLKQLRSIMSSYQNNMKYSVWVDGTKVTDNNVDEDSAHEILTHYLDKGYDEKDVWIDEEVVQIDRAKEK